MKIAIIGTRGIPANYGGFETFAENLSVRLTDAGHAVTVYGRTNNIKYTDGQYKGVNIKLLPTIGTKHLDTVVHTLISVLHSLTQDYEVVLICNAANAAFSWIPRIRGAVVVINVDGIERRRKKWGPVARAYYRLSEWLATFLPNAIVTDADTIKQYYLEKFNKDSAMIAYGADVRRERDHLGRLAAYGLEAEKYVLYVSRLEPENNAQMVVDAFGKIDTDMQLAIVGDAPHATRYIEKLKSTTDKRIKFLGFVFGPDYPILQQNAYVYIQATEVGGTHPALLEAMGFGNCVLALDTPENREVGGDATLFFDSVEDLADKLGSVLADESAVKTLGNQAMQRIEQCYGWDTIVGEYETLFESLLGKQKRATEAPS